MVRTLTNSRFELNRDHQPAVEGCYTLTPKAIRTSNQILSDPVLETLMLLPLIYPPNMSGYEFCVRRVVAQSRVRSRPLLYGSRRKVARLHLARGAKKRAIEGLSENHLAAHLKARRPPSDLAVATLPRRRPPQTPPIGPKLGRRPLRTRKLMFPTSPSPADPHLVVADPICVFRCTE